MRLIDADKLKELYQGYEGYSIPSEVILQNIEDQPTVYINLYKYAKQWNRTRTGRVSYKFIEWATDKLNDNEDEKWFEKRLTYLDENGIAHLRESELNDHCEYCYNATQKLAHYEDLQEHLIAKYNCIERAYKILVATYNTKNAEKEDALIAIEEAIGYLGEVLD